MKHKLRTKYYIRYVDDFVILHNSKEILEISRDRISKYLCNLQLELHPHKSRIITIYRGVNLLGFRVFYYHKLLKKNNLRLFERKLQKKINNVKNGNLNINNFTNSIQGWFGYAMWADTYKLRKNLLKQLII